MSAPPPFPDIVAQSAAAAAIADARIPPGDDYEEIREQVRYCIVVLGLKNVGALKSSFLLISPLTLFIPNPLNTHRTATFPLPTLLVS
jgi:hypothetical protein